MGENIGNLETKQENQAWDKLLNVSMKIPNIRVDRTTFLRVNLSKHCSEEQVNNAINTTPAMAGVADKTIAKLSKGAISYHRNIIMALSFASGLPGGWWMAGTVPADLAQFYYNCIKLTQKLAYIYGWSEIFNEGSDIDEDTKNVLTIFIGVMFGSKEAVKVINHMSSEAAKQVIKRVPQKNLTKYATYNITKKIGKWLGIRVTKQTFAKGLGKAIPVIGGVTSSGVAAAFYFPMARRLDKHFASLPIAKNFEKARTQGDD